ncbi:MAG: Crp/Fnr family transcriptional regulator [Parvularcula sp.]
MGNMDDEGNAMADQDSMNQLSEAGGDAPSAIGLAFDSFGGASSETLCRLAASAEQVAYQAGDTILASGQDDGTLLVGVAAGEVQCTRGLMVAGDIDVTVLRAGEAYGVARAVCGGSAPDPSLSLVAQTACEVVFLEEACFQRELAGSDSFARVLLKAFACEAEGKSTGDLRSVGPERRIFQHLLNLAKRRGETCLIDPMPRHAELADAAGVSARKAAEAVALLIRENVLYRDYPLMLVNDLEKLRQLAR